MNLVLTPLAIIAVLIGVLAIPFVVGVVLYNVLRFVFMIVARAASLVGGFVMDIVRLAGHLSSFVLHIPLVILSALFLRFDQAGRHASDIGTELAGVGRTLFSAVILRPLRFIGLVGPVQSPAPVSMPAQVAADLDFDFDEQPAQRMNPSEFEGYKVVGSLPRGGSGARLFVAEPHGQKAADLARQAGAAVDRVVIKSFSLEDGSTMPQIVRESRALEAARDLGLVFEHKLESSRFHYVMPYVPGDDLATVTRDLHHDSGPDGLNARSLRAALNYFSELLVTLERFHHKGLWHKDIKPSNVIVSRGRVHLVDLGLVTPLRSAMTLTTHGTEYFRDPEMVRLAMQGVKVHEVDGVKFDLYSAGALLYSMLENSFPAHGSLSRFSRRVPESLQWIVRRSMADMHKRYGAAGEMLADLEAVLRSENPYALKPSALPSMQGRKLNFKSWEAGNAGASYRVHGFEDSHRIAALGATIDHRMRDFGERVQGAGERVRSRMEHASQRFERKMNKKAARFEAKAQRREGRRKSRFGTVIGIGVLLFLGLPLVGALFLGVSQSSFEPAPYASASSYTEYTYEVHDPNGQPVLVTSDHPLAMPVAFDFDYPPSGVSLRYDSKFEGARVIFSTQPGSAPSSPQHGGTSESRGSKKDAVARVTSYQDYQALKDLKASAKVLLLDDLAKAESREIRAALETLPFELVGTGNGPEDIEVLAQAKSAVAFSGPDDAAAHAILGEFLNEHGELDAVFWLGHAGDGAKVVGQLILAQ